MLNNISPGTCSVRRFNAESIVTVVTLYFKYLPNIAHPNVTRVTSPINQQYRNKSSRKQTTLIAATIPEFIILILDHIATNGFRLSKRDPWTEELKEITLQKVE